MGKSAGIKNSLSLMSFMTFIASLLLFSSGPAYAATDRYWDGSSSNSWDDYKNWTISSDSSAVPDSYNENANINNNTKNPVQLRSTKTIGSLTIGTSASANALDIKNGGTLGIQGNISNAKTIRIYVGGILRNDATTAGTEYTISGSDGNISLLGGEISSNAGGVWVLSQNLSGYGTLSAPIKNNATITASGGTLKINNTLTTTSGTIGAATDGILDAYFDNITANAISMSGGTLASSATTKKTYSSGNISGYGTIDAPLTNTGTLTASGGTLKINNTLTTTSGTIGAATGGTLDAYFDNITANAISMSGGTLASSATTKKTYSSGNISGYGTISAPLINTGTLTASGGTSSTPRTLTLSNSNFTNNGSIIIHQYNTLDNTSSAGINLGIGTVTLLGGSLASTANRTYTNSNLISGYGTIAAALINNGMVEATSGTLTLNASSNYSTGITNNGIFKVDNGATLIITPRSVSNNGNLEDTFKNYNVSTQTLSGGTYYVAGTLQLPIQTSPTMRYIITNQANITLDGPGALIRRNAGATNTLSSLTTNDTNGIFTLKNGHAFTTTAAFTNKGTVTVDSGSSFTAASIKNSNKFNVTGTSSDKSTIGGNVTNDAGAEFKVTDTAAVFTGNFINAGAFISDPSTITFTNLTVQGSGYVQAGAGDTFKILNNFVNQSTQNEDWDTKKADLIFVGGGSTGYDTSHDLYLPGVDLGYTMKGYDNNFAWNSLDITGQTITLKDGNDTLGGALYVNYLTGAVLIGSTVTNITGADGLNIYYLPVDNPGLSGLVYSLSGGGELRPVPIPGTLLMLGTGLIGLLGIRRRFAAE